MEHERESERLEREADKLEQESERVERQVEGVRREWESKQRDPSVPGAQPDPGEEEEPVAGAETDERELREQAGP